ncbi:MAG: hypothetical protein IJZ73_06655 [Clostridia bacterium]|nr:hypothetical protein [Clostridia bacterium]
MTESKLKKVISAVTVGAVMLMVILVSVLVYQLISIKVKRNQIAELENRIAYYNQLTEEERKENQYRYELDWIENRARELGYRGLDDILID